jgi:hypothetical protein
MKIEIPLNIDEVAMSRHCGKRRKMRNRAIGNTRLITGSLEGDIEAEQQAYGAELAFCKLTNVYPDLDTTPRSEVMDCFYNECIVDVKHTRRTDRSGNLLVTKESTKKELPDVYVLVVGKLPTYWYVGWSIPDSVIRPEKLVTDLPFGHAYREWRKDLIHPLWDCKEDLAWQYLKI